MHVSRPIKIITLDKSTMILCAISLIRCIQWLIQTWKGNLLILYKHWPDGAIWTIIFVSVLKILLDILYMNTYDYNLATRYKCNLSGHVFFLLYHWTASRRKTAKPQGSPISHFFFQRDNCFRPYCCLSVPGILVQYGTNSLVSSFTAYL